MGRSPLAGARRDGLGLTVAGSPARAGRPGRLVGFWFMLYLLTL
jgi:hypothetical protein